MLLSENPIAITPPNASSVRAGDKVRCSVGDNVSAADNYRWIDSSTGDVIHHGAEWTVKQCPHQSFIVDGERIDNYCVNTTDGLMMLECHVIVGMTTVSEAVALYLIQPETTCVTAATSKS